MRRTATFALILILAACASTVPPQVLPRLAAGPSAQHALVFPALAMSWDEGLPLGNAMLGELLWANGPFVRFSLDRADLWDLRPMKNLGGPQWKYRWVVDQWKKGDYKPVQDRFDAPYDAEPAPSKIPAAALEWNVSGWGDPFEARLTLENALASVRWKNGTVLETFVQAGEPVGWIRLKGAPADFKPFLRMPPYTAPDAAGALDPVTGQDLRRLGYKQGAIRESEDFLIYRQDGWGGFYYNVAVGWRRPASGVVEIAWSASRARPIASWPRCGAGSTRPWPNTPAGGRRSGRAPPSASPIRCWKSSGISSSINSDRPPAAAPRPSACRRSGPRTTASCRRGRATSTTISTPN